MRLMFSLLVAVMFFYGNACLVKSYAEEMAIVPVQLEDEVTGHIAGVNFEDSTISLVVYTDEQAHSFETEDMYVLHEAVIEKDGAKITLKELEFNNVVTVKYRISPDGRKEIEHIWVTNSGGD